MTYIIHNAAICGLKLKKFQKCAHFCGLSQYFIFYLEEYPTNSPYSKPKFLLNLN